MSIGRIVSFALLLSSLFMLGCGGDTASTTPPQTSTSAVWTLSGVDGDGYVPNIVFHPSNSCEVWASADDMGGIYKSTDCGANWNRITTTPKNFSTYSLTFDPNNSSNLYAPSHFGWGMLKSTDGGSSWSLSQAGFPSTGTAKHVHDLAINPTDSTIIIAAVEDGLYRSTDSGATFTNLNLTWGTFPGFSAVMYLPTPSPNGRLFVGDVNGFIKFSDNDGTTWTDLLTNGPTVLPVSMITKSANAIYYLYTDGSLHYTSLDIVSANGTLNDSATGIVSGPVWPTINVVATDASQANDVIYLGTSRDAAVATTRWGLFKSTDGGANWAQQGSNVAGHSIFSIAIDPNDDQRVLIGSSDSAGIFSTTDGGTSWNSSSTGMQANVGFGFAQNPLNADELVMSSTVGFGIGKTYHSTDQGSNWSVVTEINADDGVIAMDFDPANSGTMLAGMVSTGLYRSTTGVAGPWSRVITTDIKISRIIRDSANSSIIYALAPDAPDTTPTTDIRVYYSNDNGASFSIRSLFYALDLAPHPAITNEVVVAALDNVYVSTDGLASLSPNLGLSAEATAQSGLTAVAFNPTNASELWVGGNSGGLYRTTNYNNSGTGVTWSSVTSPISNAMVRQILLRNESSVKTIYVSSFAGDVDFTAGAVLGLWKSTDNGATWTELSSNLEPCTSFWGFYPVAGSATDLWAGLWGGGGLFKLSYQ